MKLEWPGKQAFGYGEANESGFRMTMDAWEVFDGVCGHQHVPENTHWDPGALDWGTLMATEEVEEVTPAEIKAIGVEVKNVLTKPVGDAPVGQAVLQYGGIFDNDDADDNFQRTVQRILAAVNDITAQLTELESKVDDLLEQEIEPDV